MLKILRSSAQSFSFLCDKHHSPFHLAKPQTWQKRTFNCLIYPQPNPGCRTGRPPPVQRVPLRPPGPPTLLEENRTSPQGFEDHGCSMSLSSLLGTLQMCCKDRRLYHGIPHLVLGFSARKYSQSSAFKVPFGFETIL